MSLNQKLCEFFFNIETVELMQSLGRSWDQVVTEMKQLDISENLMKFYTNYRNLFNSVVLRLKLYSENNLSEEKVRKSMSVLNNTYVNSLLDYLYTVTSLKPEDSHSGTVSESVQEEVVVEQPQKLETNEVESEDEELEEDNDPFETFFDSCVEQTEETTDIVKASDFYQAFSDWYENQYDNEVPDKKELKNFLNERLGKSKKSTWTNVVLNN